MRNLHEEGRKIKEPLVHLRITWVSDEDFESVENFEWRTLNGA